MQTLTEIVAAVVVHSSAAAYAHFGVPIEAHQLEKPVPAERVVARTSAPRPAAKTAAKLVLKPGKTAIPQECPEQRALTIKT